MKFKELTINCRFTTPTYPNTLGIKLKYFGGSCCSAPHNAKLIRRNDEGQVIESVVLLSDDLDVQKEESDTSVETIIPTPTVHRKHKIEPSGEQPLADSMGRVGYTWLGDKPDPTVKPTGGGKFGG